MVESEEEYVEQLQLMVSCFLRPFKMAASSQKPPCTHDEVNSIFLNRYHQIIAQEILCEHYFILYDLQHKILKPVRCVPLTATHCRLRLTWSREHTLWTPQQWSCVMFSDESRFSFQSDSRRTLIWRAPGTRYHQEPIITIERHRYGVAGWLVWGGMILGSRTNLHV
ncbi:transposable element Tcb1 transposase [Trichonephila clavipes]|nr:transposable element Tcb1 transposase [Trichonephila clavipes]